MESWTSLGIDRLVFRCHSDINVQILTRTVLTVAIPPISSLPGVERPIASAICFMHCIVRGSAPGFILSYLEFVSNSYV